MKASRRSCPECGHHWAWLMGDGRFKCRLCAHRYKWLSVWDASRLSERDKSKLLEYFVPGVAAYRARFRAPCSRPTTERFYRQIRAVMAISEELAAPFEGAIECDETMLGGRRRGKRGWGASGKVLIFGMLKRDGVVRVFAVPNRQKATLLPLIVQHTSPGSLFYTDEYSAYASLKVQGEHIVVTKDKGIPQGRDHLPKGHPMVSKASGAMPKTGCICIVACRKSLCIFIWQNFPIASTVESKTFSPCCIRR